MSQDEIGAREGGPGAHGLGAREELRAGLIPCPDCEHSVSRSATNCPSCGRPLVAPPRAQEGPFLQTLNAGCMLALGGIVVFVLGGMALAVLQVLGHVFHLSR